MKKRGFTLVELLAVIVIIGIIALIAVPSVIKSINNSKKNNFLNSANGLFKAAKTDYSYRSMDDSILIEVVYTYKDGVETSSPSGYKLEYDGDKPQNGTIIITPEGGVALSIHNGSYCVEKDYKDKVMAISEKSLDECEIDVPTLMKVPISGWQVPFLNGPITTDQIESIEFVTTNAVPSDTGTCFWDVSSRQNQSVMAWCRDVDGNSLYEVTIGGKDDVVYANPDSSELFMSLGNLTSIDLTNLDTSKVIDMSYMFAYVTELTYLDLSSFDTSKVMNMTHMFSEMEDLQSLNISSFETKNVTDMSNMFSYIYNIETLDLSHFNTSRVTDMSDMFNYMRNLTSINLSNFDTSNVTNMSSMFEETGLLTLDLSNFDTSNVTDMNGMFYWTDISNLDLSSFNTSKVTDMSYMLGSPYISNLDVSSFDTRNVTNMSGMFSEVAVETLNLSNFNTSKVTSMHYMFWDAMNLIILDLRNATFSSVAPVPTMLQGVPVGVTIYTKNATTQSWLRTQHATANIIIAQ